MRALYLFFAVTVIAGGLMMTLKVPSSEDSRRLLASYRADEEATLQRLEAAIFACIPETARNPTGQRFAKSVIGPFYLHTVKLRFDGLDDEQFRSELQTWFKTHQAHLLTKLPDSEFLDLVGYLEVIGQDDIENCVLAYATESAESGAKIGSWALRL